MTNVVQAYKYLIDSGVNPLNVNAVVDTLGNPRVSTSKIDALPCLTASRAASLGFWLSSRSREVSLREMCRAQGLNYDKLCVGPLPISKVGPLISNAMSNNVLQRILPRALKAAGLLHTEVPDPWADPITAIRNL